MQRSTKPDEVPQTPPVSLVMPALSLLRLRRKFRMLLVSKLSRRIDGSTLSVLTKALFPHAATAPSLLPTMPPVLLRPMTLPALWQPETRPDASFFPTMPPTSLFAVTVPVKPQFITVPPLRPTMPPTALSSPVGATVPVMFRSRISASLPVSRKKPQGDCAASRDRS